MKKDIEITGEELRALFIAMQSEELNLGIVPIFLKAKIVLTLDLDWGRAWGKGGMAECWAFNLGCWLKKYRWKNINGLLRGLKKRLEKLYKIERSKKNK